MPVWWLLTIDTLEHLVLFTFKKLFAITDLSFFFTCLLLVENVTIFTLVLFYPQGIAPILPIFREGILNGTPELKEQAAKGLGEVISLTSATALRPFVVNITGPLIRILGDRFTWNVKVAVLQTLGLLLGKVCVFN